MIFELYRFKACVIILMFLTGICALHAQTDSKKDSVRTNEGSNRNVLLNAATKNAPRVVNVGLPTSTTDILENGLPVVYLFFPQNSNRNWRSSVSLSSTGLLNLAESGIMSEHFGYSVDSYTKLGGDKSTFDGNFSTSHFGWIFGDISATGPLGKGFYYTAGVYVNLDPESYDLKFSNYSDNTQIYRAGITKRFAGGRGSVSLLYKYAKSTILLNSAVFQYEEGGSVKEYNGFRIGRDSYLPVDDEFRMLDVYSGKYYTLHLGNVNDMKSVTHNLDLLADYDLGNDWKLHFAGRLYSSKMRRNLVSMNSIFSVTEADGFHYSDGTSYSGNVQNAFFELANRTPVKAAMSRLELFHNLGAHQMRLGLLEYLYDEGEFSLNRSYFYQEVAPNPHKLYNASTDEYGIYSYNNGLPMESGHENKTTLFATDEWNVNKWLDLSYTASLRYHSIGGHYSTEARTNGFNVAGKKLTSFNNSWVSPGASVQALLHITHYFGLNLSAIYNQKEGSLADYSSSVKPSLDKKSNNRYVTAGIVFNHRLMDISSSFSLLKSSNYREVVNLENPSNLSEMSSAPVNYDIKTTGWTTDVVLHPFRGFNFHALLTLQSPQYDNFSLNVFNKDWNFTGKTVRSISKTLIELDPSYTTNNGKFRFWVSARYFGKQYANYTNVLFFKGWWETFGGVNYKVNRHASLSVNVTNPLNQRGAKGVMGGASLITDPTPYYGKLIASSAYIRPFTVEATLSLHF